MPTRKLPDRKCGVPACTNAAMSSVPIQTNLGSARMQVCVGHRAAIRQVVAPRIRTRRVTPDGTVVLPFKRKKSRAA